MQNKTSKKKEEVKIAQAYGCEEIIVYSCNVDCPDCGWKNFIDKYQSPPTYHFCDNADCNKQFNIEWE